MKIIVTEDIFYFFIIVLIIIVTSGLSWREKNKARNFVLASKRVLEDLLNEAQDLVEVNPDTHPAYIEDFDNMLGDLIDLFDGINENSFDICWTTKQKEVSEFKKSVIAKISEIKRCVKLEPDIIELYVV